jgi:CRP/FNR family cyclic AMP-dependent transcriptional regulator
VSVDAAALKNVPLFSSLSEKELKKLVPLFHEHSFDAGHVIAEEGHQGLGFFMIKSGTAKVTAHGKPRVTGGPGGQFGDIAALDPGPRVATVTAETDLSVYRLDAWDFRRLVTEDAALAVGIIEGLVQMVRRLEGYQDTDATGADAGANGP